MLTKNDLQAIEGIVEKKLKPVKKDISGMKKDIKTIVNYFDRVDTKLNKRVTRIETHLGFAPLE